MYHGIKIAPHEFLDCSFVIISVVSETSIFPTPLLLFFVASSISVVDPTSSSYFHPFVFFHPRPLNSATAVVPLHCLFSSSSTAAMTSKTNMKSTSKQTVSSSIAHSLKTAIFKTLALKIDNEISNGTIAPSTRRAFFKILYNIFVLYSKKIIFEKYYRIHLRGTRIAVCETTAMSLSSIELLLNKIISISSMPCKKL